MAQCKDCIHNEVCRYHDKLAKIDKYNWFSYNELDNVQDFCEHFIADVVPKSEVDRLEKESSAFAEIIHKQEDEIQQLRKSLLTKQALEEEFSKSVKKIEKQALKTIEKAKQEVAREIFEEIERTLPNDFPFLGTAVAVYLGELKKKYTEEKQ